MVIESTALRFRFYLTMVLVVSAMASDSFGSGCWDLSPPGSNPELVCPIPQLPCIELEESGLVIAADCCQLSDDCTSSCTYNDELPPGSIIRPATIRFVPPTQPPLKVDTEIRHVIPSLPVFVDHVALAPEALKQFDGVSLHFLMCQDEGGDVDLRAFTTWRDLLSQVQSCGFKDPSFAVPEAPHRTSGGIAVYEAPKWNGASYFLPNGQSVVFEDSWWNDRVSSLRGIGTGTFVTFFETADHGGSSLTLTTGFGWPDLSVFGWDGRVSSAMVWATEQERLPLPSKAADR